MVTFASLLTPNGRGAIATISVQGTDAVEIAAALFISATNRSVQREPIGSILFGNWKSTESSSEELVVCRTGADIVEVQCHGGPAAVEAILNSLSSRGCVVRPWTESLGDENIIVAEARMALAGAITERTAMLLLAQLNGALGDHINQIAELCSDKPEQAVSELDSLVRSFEIGSHLTVPWKVVVSGPPNVGKSSLINALIGFDRTIVFDQPGTTRDVVTVRTAMHGWPVELSDTAGIRASDDPLENEGVARAKEQLSKADLVVNVYDAQDFRAESVVPQPDDIIVLNKCDLAMPDRENDLGYVETIATERKGIADLLDRIVGTLVSNPSDQDTPIVFTERQFRHCEKALSLLKQGDVQTAKSELLLIVGPAVDV